MAPPASLASIPIAPAPPQVQRAVVNAGPLSIHVDYGSVVKVTAADVSDRLVAAVEAYTGMAPDLIQDSTLRGLPSTAQFWLLYALKLLADNRGRAPLLSPSLALERLIQQAPLSTNQPLPDPDRLFVHEVMEFSGWLESALTSRLNAPGAADSKEIGKIVNAGEEESKDKKKKKKPPLPPEFEARLRPALEHLLTAVDPGAWKNKGTHSLSTFRTLGDVIQEEARKFFSPYADAAMGNIFSLAPRWHASANIFSTQTLVPDFEQRISYLDNRAELIGRSTEMSFLVPDPNIFAETKFDSKDDGHVAELRRILGEIEKDPKYQPILDRIIQQTAQKTGSGRSTRISMPTVYNAARQSACKAHWAGVDTLCHEVLHGLVHPKFQAAVTRVTFKQVIREGFTEVLGNQLFNEHVTVKAKDDKAFKARIEAGVPGAPCPEPDKGTIGYGAAGPAANDILGKVGDNRFRAAYFLGRTELAGLP